MGPVTAILGQEALGVGPRVLVDNAEKNHLGIVPRALRLHEHRVFLTAWNAPGGPEVEDHDLSLEVGQLHGVALERDEFEGRGLQARHRGRQHVCIPAHPPVQQPQHR